MINFFVNGEKIDVELESEQTIGDVLNSFEKTCEENKAAVIGIIIDDRQITSDIFDETASLPLKDDTKFEFSVITVQSIKESFQGLTSLFSELSEKIEKVPVEFQKGNNKEAIDSIKTLTDSIEQFCHVAALASLFPEEFSNTNIEGQNFRDFFGDFSKILLDFEQALQANDTVLIGDLCEYEICPRLQQISNSLKSIS